MGNEGGGNRGVLDGVAAIAGLRRRTPNAERRTLNESTRALSRMLTA
jgi:hypothetical protein